MMVVKDLDDTQLNELLSFRVLHMIAQDFPIPTIRDERFCVYALDSGVYADYTKRGVGLDLFKNDKSEMISRGKTKFVYKDFVPYDSEREIRCVFFDNQKYQHFEFPE